MAPAAFSGLAEGSEPTITVDPETGLETAVFESFELTDPRASGTWTQVGDVAVLKDGKLEYVAGRGSVRLVNDGGAWVGT